MGGGKSQKGASPWSVRNPAKAVRRQAKLHLSPQLLPTHGITIFCPISQGLNSQRQATPTPQIQAVSSWEQDAWCPQVSWGCSGSTLKQLQSHCISREANCLQTQISKCKWQAVFGEELLWQGSWCTSAASGGRLLGGIWHFSSSVAHSFTTSTSLSHNAYLSWSHFGKPTSQSYPKNISLEGFFRKGSRGEETEDSKMPKLNAFKRKYQNVLNYGFISAYDSNSPSLYISGDQLSNKAMRSPYNPCLDI